MPSLITIGAIIDQTFHRYRAHSRELISISLTILAGYPCFIVAAILFTLLPKSATAVVGAAMLVLVGGIISFFASIMSVNTLILAAHAAEEKNRIPVRTLMRTGWSKVVPAVILWFMIAIITLSSVLLMAPGAALLWMPTTGEYFLIAPTLGVLFLFLGGIAALALCAYLGVTYIFAPYALILEGRRSLEALQRAHTLVKNRWAHVALRVIVPKLTILVLFLFANIIIVTLLNILAAATIDASLLTKGNLALTIVILVKRVAITILTACVTPFFALADYYVFRNLVDTLEKRNASSR